MIVLLCDIPTGTCIMHGRRSYFRFLFDSLRFASPYVHVILLYPYMATLCYRPIYLCDSQHRLNFGPDSNMKQPKRRRYALSHRNRTQNQFRQASKRIAVIYRQNPRV
jgi:hypothetical protein